MCSLYNCIRRIEICTRQCPADTQSNIPLSTQHTNTCSEICCGLHLYMQILVHLADHLDGVTNGQMGILIYQPWTQVHHDKMNIGGRDTTKHTRFRMTSI
jgi:hypothetical protein